MKLETIVDALLDSHYKLIHHWNERGHDKRYRQRDAFRDRIIRMDKEKDAEIDKLRQKSDDFDKFSKSIFSERSPHVD